MFLPIHTAFQKPDGHTEEIKDANVSVPCPVETTRGMHLVRPFLIEKTEALRLHFVGHEPDAIEGKSWIVWQDGE